jgi:hypothetical protein
MKHSIHKNVKQLGFFSDSEELLIRPFIPLVVLPENKQKEVVFSLDTEPIEAYSFFACAIL